MGSKASLKSQTSYRLRPNWRGIEFLEVEDLFMLSDLKTSTVHYNDIALQSQITERATMISFTLHCTVLVILKYKIFSFTMPSISIQYRY